MLRRRISIEKDPQLRGELHIELGGLVMAMLGEVEGLGREAIEEEAERELRAGLDVDPKNEEARALLERLYLDRGRYLELGRVLGRDVLERLRSEAESAADGDRLRGILSALAEMSEGTERAALLVELVGYAGDAGATPGLPRTVEDLYRAALVADPAHATAREGLRALLESEGRYREIAEALDISALMETVDGLRQAEAQHAQLLPAALSLVTVLDEEDAPASGRAALWTEIADLHLEDGDGEAGGARASRRTRHPVGPRSGARIAARAARRRAAARGSRGRRRGSARNDRAARIRGRRRRAADRRARRARFTQERGAACRHAGADRGARTRARQDDGRRGPSARGVGGSSAARARAFGARSAPVVEPPLRGDRGSPRCARDARADRSTPRRVAGSRSRRRGVDRAADVRRGPRASVRARRSHPG